MLERFGASKDCFGNMVNWQSVMSSCVRLADIKAWSGNAVLRKLSWKKLTKETLLLGMAGKTENPPLQTISYRLPGFNEQSHIPNGPHAE